MTVSEIEVVLENYEIILTQVDKMDPLHDSSITKQLLHTILDVHMPIILKEELEQLKKQLKGNKTCEAIHKITKMEDRYGKRSHDRSIMKPFLSPIVLLLKLAEEVKAFSFAQREEWKQPDWGRLTSFREYLEGLQLRSSRGRDKHYYPGLPSCILSLIPVWTSHEAVISASNDNFEATGNLRAMGHTLRSNQLCTLRERCTSRVQKRIQDLEKASIKFKKWYDDLNTPQAKL